MYKALFVGEETVCTGRLADMFSKLISNRPSRVSVTIQGFIGATFHSQVQQLFEQFTCNLYCTGYDAVIFYQSKVPTSDDIRALKAMLEETQKSGSIPCVAIREDAVQSFGSLRDLSAELGMRVFACPKGVTPDQSRMYLASLAARVLFNKAPKKGAMLPIQDIEEKSRITYAGTAHSFNSAKSIVVERSGGNTDKYYRVSEQDIQMLNKAAFYGGNYDGEGI